MANTKITNPELFNLGDSTSATQLPVMTTTQRIAMNAVPTLVVDYLVVAGGGGGGMGYYGGGGGAGGLLTNVGGTSLVLATGGSGYTVTVGDGGSGAASKTVNGTNGSNSRFNAIEAYGGGGAASRNTTGGSSGGSGGGASNPGNAGGSATVGQGNDGGTLTGQRYGSGGGGANQAGQIPPQTYSQTPQNYSIGAPGGNGLEVNITGVDTFYAGGGGAGARATYSPNGINGGLGGGGAGGAVLPGSNGIDELGGGGGGGGFDNDSGGSGGSGIVILRYPTADIASYTATGLTPTETTDGTDTILSFTTVGTGAITFTSSTPTGTISTGEMIFNSTTDKVEYWDGTKWYGITYEVDYLYNNILWTGDGTNNRIITGLGFTPDFVWIKNRATNDSHQLFDSLRDENLLYSNDTAQQFFIPDWEIINDGFDLGSAYPDGRNGNGNGIVAWCWKAGGAAVANTNGNIASQVSANVDGGFSIVKWSGNDTTGGTIGHGLSSTPELTIIKKTSATANWQVSLNASVTGVEGYMNLDANAALYTTYPLYYTSSNSTVLSSNGTSTGTRVYNNQSANYIAYCFHSVPGYSKVGSYTGTGSNMTVNVGFEPAFVMIKNTTSSASWHIFDNKRTAANPSTEALFPNESSAAADYNTVFEFTSTGFNNKVTSTSLNSNGSKYVYLTFA